MSGRFQLALALVICLITSSCGALKINPSRCAGEGIWGNNPTSLRDESAISFNQTYYIWMTDLEVRLRDFLLARNIDCKDIKKIRLSIKSEFFVKKNLMISILK